MRDDGFVGNSGGCDIVEVGMLLAAADIPGTERAIDYVRHLRNAFIRLYASTCTFFPWLRR